MALPTRDSVIADVTAYVANSFDKDWRRAFERHSENGKMSRDHLIDALKAANVGSRLTRGMVADGVMAEVDSDKDGFITFDEFESIASLV